MYYNVVWRYVSFIWSSDISKLTYMLRHDSLKSNITSNEKILQNRF